MIDLETGRFILGEGLEVWPGMKLEDFRETELYAKYVNEWNKTEKNEIYYGLLLEEVDGFELDITLHFSSHDDYLTHIYIEKKDWQICEVPPVYEKIGRANNYEYENSILRYLNVFLSSQMSGQIEGGRELTYSYKWGGINTVFTPYDSRNPADIKIVIKYRTRLFKPNRKVKTLEELWGI